MDFLNVAFIVLNALILMVGVTLSGCGIWLVTESDTYFYQGWNRDYRSFDMDTAVFQVGVSLIIVVGALSVLLSFLECRTVYKENKPLPSCRAVIILCMVVFECVAITLVSVYWLTFVDKSWSVDDKTNNMTNAILGLTGVLLFLQICVLVLFVLRNNRCNCNEKAVVVLEKLEDKIIHYLPHAYKQSTVDHLVPKTHVENIVYD